LEAFWLLLLVGLFIICLSTSDWSCFSFSASSSISRTRAFIASSSFTTKQQLKNLSLKQN
jgi:hypothetical protein